MAVEAICMCANILIFVTSNLAICWWFYSVYYYNAVVDFPIRFSYILVLNYFCVVCSTVMTNYSVSPKLFAYYGDF